MSICQQCEGEMMDEISCLSDPITIGSESFEPIRWGSERQRSRWVIDFPCRDCHTPLGGVHHPGCCVERCPACLGQALGCPCFGTDDDDDYADFYDIAKDDDENDCDRFGGGDGGGAGDRTDDDDDDDDLAAHVRISMRCRSHLFRRHFRR
jgi:hypothetical protein